MTDQDPRSLATRVQRRIALGRLFARSDAEARDAERRDETGEADEGEAERRAARGSNDDGDLGGRG